jgi:DNA-binding SARP family transcriptional activator
VEFRILGSLQVLDGDTPVEVTGAKQRAVLALLIVRANEVVGSERLIDELWGEQAPRNAAAALYSHVSRLRKALGPEVLARREWGYVLRTPPESIDLHRFEVLLSEAEQLPAKERARKLTEALALWRGPPLAGLESEVGLQREIARLEELRVETIERRIDADLEIGRNSELVGELEMLIAEQPLREHLRWQLILSLYRAGRQAEGLEVYRETRRVLAEELGLDPSPELRELEKAILRQDPSLATTATPAREPRAPQEQATSRPGYGWLLSSLLGLAVLASGVTAAIALVRSDKPGRTTAGSGTLVIITKAAPASITKPATVRTTHHSRTKAHLPARPPTTSTTPVTTATPRPTSPPTTNSHATTTARPPKTTTKQPTPPPATTMPRPPTTTTTTPKTPPKLVTISDTFGSDFLDPLIWGGTVLSDGNVSIVETGGQLQITVGAQAQPLLEHYSWGDSRRIDVHVGTACSFPGDFDMRVDYTLPEWPVGDGVIAFLGSADAGGAVGRQSVPSGDEYQGWIWPNGNLGNAPLPDSSGTLRIARVNGVETAYFRHLGSWSTLARGYFERPGGTGARAAGVGCSGAFLRPPRGEGRVRQLHRHRRRPDLPARQPAAVFVGGRARSL